MQANPDTLEAYDDAGVACDRLGRDDEAITWMERKRQRLDALEARGLADHSPRYRCLANAGTFWVHRWLRQGADRTKLDQVKTARDLIAAAIHLNPTAHFGREPYQLKIMDWIIAGKPFSLDGGGFPTFVDFAPGKDNPHAAVEALAGLIMLGNAWESVDVYNALVKALDADGERTSMALLARQRCLELIRQGKTSLVPGAPKGKDLEIWIARPVNMVHKPQELEKLYHELRKEADAWHKARTDYIIERLRRGEHPDLSASRAPFWADFHEPAPPALLTEAVQAVEYGRFVPEYRAPSPWQAKWPIVRVLALVALIALLLAFLFRRSLGRVLRPGYGSAWTEPPKSRRDAGSRAG